MAYASITYTSASGTTFALTNSSGNPIQYLRQADISVTVNGVLKTQGTDYTFNSAGTAIVLAAAVTSATVVISRTTSITDATVSFTAGSTLTAQDLNNSDKQNRFALQEFSDIYGALTTGTGDLSALGGFIGSAETWLSDNAHAPTTGAVDTRVDSKIDTALTTDVVAGDSITVTDNSPSSGQITIGVTNASISTAKLVDSSVTTAKIADGNVTTAKILDANVTTTKLADSNVTTAKIADSAVTSAKIADGTIVAGDIAADAVTTAKILDSNVTTGKIADGAVTTAKLADSSVTSAKIVDGTIVAGDLASDSVTTAKIVDSNVTTAKINDSAVTTGKIADSAVTAIKIADGVITSAKLNAATVVTAAEQAACTPDDVTFFTTSASDGRYVNVTGDSMTGALAMGSNKITGLGAPTANADAATKQYVDTSVAAGVGDADYGDITVSGTGTVWTIDSGVVTSAKIADGTIVDGDINASAAIALSKLATGALPTAITVASANIVDGTIVNADVNAAAAIAGTKISPDFGSQNVTTTGTVTGASLSPTSSTAPTNGVYLPSANTVGISTGGSGRLFINGSGSVGINTSSPAAGLDVNNNAYTRGGHKVSGYFATSAGDGYVINIGSSGTVNYIQSLNGATQSQLSIDGNPIVFRGASFAEIARFDTSGRLGIGTSSPGRRLVIAGDTNTVCAIQGANNGTSSVFLGDTDDESIGAFTYNHVSNHLEVKVNGAERVRVDSSGRLGIGTASPSSLNSTGNQLVVGSGTGNQGLTIFAGSSSDSNIYFADGTAGTAPNIGYIQYRHASDRFDFGTVDTTRMSLDSAGRLLVGTSSARSTYSAFDGNTGTPQLQIEGNRDGIGLYYAAANDEGSRIFLSKARASFGLVSNNDELGRITFCGSDGNYLRPGAAIQCLVDGTPSAAGAGDMPGRLVFSTTADGASSPTERVRITNSGYFKASTLGGVYIGATAGHHEFVSNTNGQYTLHVQSNADTSNQYGLQIRTSADQNDSTRLFLNCVGDTTQRAAFRTNGGLANYSANNANLSDRNVKKDITPAAGTWDCIKEWEIVNYRYKDQPDDADLNLGVIAQQVAESCPEVITVFQEAKEATEDQPAQEERLGVKEQQMYWMAIKALQEAQVRIEQLEAKVSVLESKP